MVQRTSLDVDTAVTRAGGDGSRGVNQARGPPLGPSTGSTKAESLVSSTDLGVHAGHCMWLLGSGKQSILPDPDGVEGVAQFLGSAWKGSCPTAPQAHSTPRGACVPGGSLEQLAPPAHSSALRGGASVATSGLWRMIRASLRLTPLLALPAGASGRGLLYARS